MRLSARVRQAGFPLSGINWREAQASIIAPFALQARTVPMVTPTCTVQHMQAALLAVSLLSSASAMKDILCRGVCVCVSKVGCLLSIKWREDASFSATFALQGRIAPAATSSCPVQHMQAVLLAVSLSTSATAMQDIPCRSRLVSKAVMQVFCVCLTCATLHRSHQFERAMHALVAYDCLLIIHR